MIRMLPGSWDFRIRSFWIDDTLEQGMVQAQLIAILDYMQAAILKAAQQVLRMIHLAVAIGDTREIERSLLETESSGFVRLTIPKKFEDIQPAICAHSAGDSSEN